MITIEQVEIILHILEHKCKHLLITQESDPIYARANQKIYI